MNRSRIDTYNNAGRRAREKKKNKRIESPVFINMNFKSYLYRKSKTASLCFDTVSRRGTFNFKARAIYNERLAEYIHTQIDPTNYVV